MPMPECCKCGCKSGSRFRDEYKISVAEIVKGTGSPPLVTACTACATRYNGDFIAQSQPGCECLATYDFDMTPPTCGPGGQDTLTLTIARNGANVRVTVTLSYSVFPMGYATVVWYDDFAWPLECGSLDVDLTLRSWDNVTCNAAAATVHVLAL